MIVGNRVRIVNPHSDRLGQLAVVWSMDADVMFPVQVQFADATMGVFKEEELELVQDELPLQYDVTKNVPPVLPHALLHHPMPAFKEEMTSQKFVVKDSGKREQFVGGMVRDTAEGKVNWALVADGPMLRRWAEHLTRGANKYAKRNWMLAAGQEELDRARESAYRHFMQWFNGERDEDHGSAVFFNINQAEFVRNKMEAKGATK